MCVCVYSYGINCFLYRWLYVQLCDMAEVYIGFGWCISVLLCCSCLYSYIYVNYVTHVLIFMFTFSDLSFIVKHTEFTSNEMCHVNNIFIATAIYDLLSSFGYLYTKKGPSASCCLSVWGCYGRSEQIDVVNGLLGSPIVTVDQGEAPLQVRVCKLWWSSTAKDLVDRSGVYKMCRKLQNWDHKVIGDCLNKAWH